MAKVIWTEPALNALDEIADHIAFEDYEAACRWVRRVFEKIDLLEETPKLGNVPNQLRTTPYRRLIIKPAYIYYRIDNDRVVIIFVERTERDFEISRFSR
jgi:toxin ParE1/3/4